MPVFMPKRVFFEPDALNYPLGVRLYEKFRNLGVEIKMTGSHNRVTGLPGKTPLEAYSEAKHTLVVGVRRSREFATCKPSAHYQLPLTTSCPSMCEYCYLQTTLGKWPYLRVYVNLEEILVKAAEYIEARKPEVTWFEGAATSDPIPVEHLTGAVRRTIEFFGQQTYGRFRFVTKHIHVESLLTAIHNNHTRFRFSLNCDHVIRKYEHATPSMEERIHAASKVSKAGYPLGFIIAPIIVFEGWQEEYAALFKALATQLAPDSRHDLTFELITHRFTKRAKANILALRPYTELPLEEEHRTFKYGQFGYGKYVYPPDMIREIRSFMEQQIGRYFPAAQIEYFI